MLKKTTSFGFPLLAGLPLEKAERIQATIKRKTIPAGTKLMSEGEKSGKVYWILEGNTAMRWVWEGAPRLTAFITLAPALLGHIEAWKDEPSCCDAVAMEDLDVYEIDRAAFLGLVQTHHQIAVNVASYTGTIFCESIRVQHQFLFGKAEEVVARSVYFLARLYGKKVGDLTVVDKLTTRTQLALICGISRRAAISVLQELEDAGILQSEGRSLKILNEKGLKKLCGKGISDL